MNNRTDKSKPIRVLQIVSYMQRGGLETLLMNYYRNIDRDKVQFDFIVHRPFTAAYDKEIEELGGKIYRLPRLNPFSRRYHKALDEFFENHKEYKVVHCHLDCMSSIPLKHAKKNNIPVTIAHAHSSDQTVNYKYLLKMYFKRQIPKTADYLFACSKAAGKFMFNEHEFRVLNNAIDTKKYIFNENIRSLVRRNLGILDNQLVIGHVGRFSQPKNHVFLISVFCEILKKNDNARLLLVGDGVLFDKIKALCKEKNIYEKVIFTGSRADVYDLMQAMDILVFPSLFEGFPVTMVEAQAAGLPSLISDRIPEECIIIKNLVHVFSLSENENAWAEKVLDIPVSRMTDTALKIVSAGYDIRKNALDLQNFYLEQNGRYQ